MRAPRATKITTTQNCRHLKLSDDTATNSYTNLSCTTWFDINLLVEWKYKIIKIDYVGSKIFNWINFIMSHQFIQNKFVQIFVGILLLFKIKMLLYLHLNWWFTDISSLKKLSNRKEIKCVNTDIKSFIKHVSRNYSTVHSSWFG